MVALAPCPSCVAGDHTGHVEQWNPAPPGIFGGSCCVCTGDCGERAREVFEKWFPPPPPAARWKPRDRVMALLIAEEAEQDALNARLEQRYQELSDEEKAADDALPFQMRKYTRSLGSGLVSIEDIERAIDGDVLFIPAVLLAMIGTVKWHHARVHAQNTREGRHIRHRVILTMSTRDVRAAMENDPEGIMDFFRRQDLMNRVGAMTDEEVGPFTVL